MRWYSSTRFEQWTVDVTKLTYYPPGSVTESRRAWFELNVEQKNGTWTVQGVNFVHAWARKSPVR